MKTLFALILCLASLSAFGNGRCQYPNSSQWADCRPPVPVLMYHHVSATIEPGETVVSLESFEKQIDVLKSEGWTTITMSQLGYFIARKKQIPRKSVVITFDDGWRDQLQAAIALKKRNQVATFYILSAAFDDSNYMTRQEVVDLSRDFEIGTHTHTHFKAWIDDLTKLETATAIGEVLMSKVLIEEVIKKPVTSLAWPYGYFTEETKRFVKSIGITTIATVQDWNGPNRRIDERTNDLFDLQRLNIDGRCTIEDFMQMVESLQQRTCK